MKNLKLLSLILITSLSFSGCFGGDKEATIETAGKLTYETETFLIVAPESWDAFDSTDFTSNVPSEISVGFRNNIKNETFTANLNISESALQNSNILSTDFGISTLSQSKNSLLSYREIDRQNIEITSDEEQINTFLVEFEGKRNSSEPIIIFQQSYAVKNGIGYTITAAYLQTENESVVKQLNEMIDSFALK